MMLRGWCSSSAGGGTVERDREREGRGAALGDPEQGCGHQGGWRHTEGPGLLDLLRKSPEERESGEGEGGEGCPWKSRAGVWPPGWMAPHLRSRAPQLAQEEPGRKGKWRGEEGEGAALGDPGQGCGHQGGWRHTEGPGLLNLLRKSPEERESGEE